MKCEVLRDEEALARRAAGFIAETARTAISSRGRFSLALSGGATPLGMFARLAEETLPWDRVDLFQVDERVAPAGDDARNLTHLRRVLLDHIAIPAARVHAMPVESPDLALAASQYQALLHAATGTPAVLDLVHLGLGEDGHTASLVPGDAVLDETEREVAVTALYHGTRRMTLTYSVLSRARQIVWLVSGGAKKEALTRLLRGDVRLAAARVVADRALLLADRAAYNIE